MTSTAFMHESPTGKRELEPKLLPIFTPGKNGRAVYVHLGSSTTADALFDVFSRFGGVRREAEPSSPKSLSGFAIEQCTEPLMDEYDLSAGGLPYEVAHTIEVPIDVAGHLLRELQWSKAKWGDSLDRVIAYGRGADGKHSYVRALDGSKVSAGDIVRQSIGELQQIMDDFGVADQGEVS